MAVTPIETFAFELQNAFESIETELDPDQGEDGVRLTVSINNRSVLWVVWKPSQRGYSVSMKTRETQLFEGPEAYREAFKAARGMLAELAH